jgi:hypothetical protein
VYLLVLAGARLLLPAAHVCAARPRFLQQVVNGFGDPFQTVHV